VRHVAREQGPPCRRGPHARHGQGRHRARRRGQARAVPGLRGPAPVAHRGRGGRRQALTHPAGAADGTAAPARSKPSPRTQEQAMKFQMHTAIGYDGTPAPSPLDTREAAREFTAALADLFQVEPARVVHDEWRTAPYVWTNVTVCLPAIGTA